METLKEKLILWLTRKLLPIIDPRDIVVFAKNGMIFVGGEQMGDAELRAMKEEIKFLEETKTWKLLTNYLNNQARLKMFEESQSFQDVLIGKMMLYNTNVQKEILERIKNTKLH